jgi:hypothetical protein
MTEREIIVKGFEYLKEDCRRVLMCGFVKESDIPIHATKEKINKGLFDHSYDDLNSNGWDECDFWGDIYLPFGDGTYMKFEVGA